MCVNNICFKDLHSTMYLLNLFQNVTEQKLQRFTFHYVSIKSNSRVKKDSIYFNLHSTMYLLNPKRPWLLYEKGSTFTFHYVSIKSQPMAANFFSDSFNLHSTMYLLNLGWDSFDCSLTKKFTFHYVSIKSQRG